MIEAVRGCWRGAYWGGERSGVAMLRYRQFAIRRCAGFGLLLAGLLFLSPVPAAAASGPSEAIRQFYAQLLDTMQHATALGVKGRYQKLEPVVFRTFDVPYMARLSIGLPNSEKLASVSGAERSSSVLRQSTNGTSA